jgi:hypothetical protein
MADEPIRSVPGGEATTLQDDDKNVLERSLSNFWWTFYTLFLYIYSKILGQPIVVVDTGTDVTLPAFVYANGASGVGATLTASANGALSGIGGITPTVGMRVLVKDQTNDIHNGCYTITNLGSPSTTWVMTRMTNSDTGSELNDQVVAVKNGSQAGIYTQVTATPTVGTSAIIYIKGDGGRAVIRITANDFKDLIVNSTAKYPRTYIITDKGEFGTIINTNGPNSTDGVGIVIARYPNFDLYSRWYVTKTVTTNSYHIWNHRVYQSITGTSNQPDSNPSHWTLIPYSDGTRYNSGFDPCRYDPLIMVYAWRAAGYGGQYAEFPASELFPFGAPNLSGITIKNTNIPTSLINTNVALTFVDIDGVGSISFNDSENRGAANAFYNCKFSNLTSLTIFAGNQQVGDLIISGSANGQAVYGEITIKTQQVSGTGITSCRVENCHGITIKEMQGAVLKNIDCSAAPRVYSGITNSIISHVSNGGNVTNIINSRITGVDSSTISNVDTCSMDNIAAYDMDGIINSNISNCSGLPNSLNTIQDCLIVHLDGTDMVDVADSQFIVVHNSTFDTCNNLSVQNIIGYALNLDNTSSSSFENIIDSYTIAGASNLSIKHCVWSQLSIISDDLSLGTNYDLTNTFVPNGLCIHTITLNVVSNTNTSARLKIHSPGKSDGHFGTIDTSTGFNYIGSVNEFEDTDQFLQVKSDISITFEGFMTLSGTILRTL